VRRLISAAVAAALVLAVAPARGATDRITDDFDATTPHQTAGLPNLDVIDPVRYSLDDALVDHVQVSSRDGIHKIWVDYVRPKTAAGFKVPTIMMASPYFNTLGRGYHEECKKPTQSPPGGLPGSPGTPGLSGCVDHQTAFPEWYDEYFVPRGYAFAAMDLRGTRNSTGCQTYGDRDEVLDAVDVVDWIAEQPWSNGKVGMTGGSYDGTVALGAATEQPLSGKHKDALAAVIPIRSIDRWYDYHFFNGVQSEGHAATPAEFTAVFAGADLPNSGTEDPLYPVSLVERKACIASFGAMVDAGYATPYQDADSAFWQERDFARDAKTMRAAVFFLHGLVDFNVKTVNVGNMWSQLPAGVPKKLWFFNADHADPRCQENEKCSDHQLPYPFADRFVEATHRWWLQYLKGVPAGALADGPVEVQRNDGHWDKLPRYPTGVADTKLQFLAGGRARPGGGAEGSVSWADGASTAPDSVSFVTDPVKTATHLSGQFRFDLAYTTTGPDTTFGIEIADLGPDDEDSATARERAFDAEDQVPWVVSYAWLRAWYRASVKPRGLSTPSHGSPLIPGQQTKSSFPSLYTDYMLPAGHRLRFTFSSAAGGTIPASMGGTVTLSLPGSTVSLPTDKSLGGKDFTPPAAGGSESGGGGGGAGGGGLAATGLPLGYPLGGVITAVLLSMTVRRRRSNRASA
jgi:X-Pro dipeptidyl-peptidase